DSWRAMGPPPSRLRSWTMSVPPGYRSWTARAARTSPRTISTVPKRASGRRALGRSKPGPLSGMATLRSSLPSSGPPTERLASLPRRIRAAISCSFASAALEAIEAARARRARRSFIGLGRAWRRVASLVLDELHARREGAEDELGEALAGDARGRLGPGEARRLDEAHPAAHEGSRLGGVLGEAEAGADALGERVARGLDEARDLGVAPDAAPEQEGVGGRVLLDVGEVGVEAAAHGLERARGRAPAVDVGL